MRIFLIGHKGYVGSFLSRRLRGHAVTGIDLVLGVDYRLIRAETLRSHDAIIHLAAHSSVRACEDDPWGAIRNNLFGVIELAEKLNGTPLIYASSGSVHSRDANTIYDRTKRAADEMVLGLNPNAWGLRFGTVCGVSPTMRTDTLLNGITRDAVREGVIRMRNQGRHRPLLTLDDLAWFVECCLNGEVPPGIHDVATFNCRIGGYADMVSEVTGCEIISEPDTPTYDFSMPVLGRTESLFPVIEELVAHWKQN